MRNIRVKFGNKQHKDWRGLELPRGTIIEVECLPELCGEVIDTYMG